MDRQAFDVQTFAREEQLACWRHKFVEQTGDLRKDLNQELDGLYDAFINTRDTLLTGALAVYEELQELRGAHGKALEQLESCERTLANQRLKVCVLEDGKASDREQRLAAMVAEQNQEVIQLQRALLDAKAHGKQRRARDIDRLKVVKHDMEERVRQAESSLHVERVASARLEAKVAELQRETDRLTSELGEVREKLKAEHKAHNEREAELVKATLRAKHLMVGVELMPEREAQGLGVSDCFGEELGLADESSRPAWNILYMLFELIRSHRGAQHTIRDLQANQKTERVKHLRETQAERQLWADRVVELEERLKVAMTYQTNARENDLEEAEKRVLELECNMREACIIHQEEESRMINLQGEICILQKQVSKEQSRLILLQGQLEEARTRQDEAIQMANVEAELSAIPLPGLHGGLNCTTPGRFTESDGKDAENYRVSALVLSTMKCVESLEAQIKEGTPSSNKLAELQAKLCSATRIEREEAEWVNALQAALSSAQGRVSYMKGLSMLDEANSEFLTPREMPQTTPRITTDMQSPLHHHFSPEPYSEPIETCNNPARDSGEVESALVTCSNTTSSGTCQSASFVSKAIDEFEYRRVKEEGQVQEPGASLQANSGQYFVPMKWEPNSNSSSISGCQASMMQELQEQLYRTRQRQRREICRGARLEAELIQIQRQRPNEGESSPGLGVQLGDVIPVSEEVQALKKLVADLQERLRKQGDGYIASSSLEGHREIIQDCVSDSISAMNAKSGVSQPLVRRQYPIEFTKPEEENVIVALRHQLQIKHTALEDLTERLNSIEASTCQALQDSANEASRALERVQELEGQLASKDDEIQTISLAMREASEAKGDESRAAMDIPSNSISQTSPSWLAHATKGLEISLDLASLPSKPTNRALLADGHAEEVDGGSSNVQGEFVCMRTENLELKSRLSRLLKETKEAEHTARVKVEVAERLIQEANQRIAKLEWENAALHERALEAERTLDEAFEEEDEAKGNEGSNVNTNLGTPAKVSGSEPRALSALFGL